MTELNIAEHPIRRAGVRRMKKANLQIDMTPMVDLGFLLISFFIFTTELSKPFVTKLYMPHDGEPTPIPGSKTMTVLLNGNKVFYYFGNLKDAVKNNQILETSPVKINGLGNLIRQKQHELENRKINKNELVIVIKPGNESSYKDLVNALDEMLINKVTKYSLGELEHEESTFLKE